IIEEMGSCNWSTIRNSAAFVAFNNAIYFTHCDGERVQLYRHEIGVAGAIAVTDFTEQTLVNSSLGDETIARLGDELIVPIGPNVNSVFRHDLYRFDGEDFTEIDLGHRDVREPLVLETPNAVYFTVVDSTSLNSFYPAYIRADSPADLHYLTYQGDTIREIFGNQFHPSDSSVYFAYQGQVLRHHPSSEVAELYYSLPDDTLEDLLSPFILDDRLLFLATSSFYGRELYEVTDLNEVPRRVTDIRTGPPNSNILGMAAQNNRLFFAANDGLRGSELWSYYPGCFTLVLTSVTSSIDLPTGEVVATPNGGIAPFSYQWSSGDSTAILSNINAGFYEVTVTDASGCSVSEYTWVETNGMISYNEESDVVTPSIMVYPNPFHDRFSLRLEEVAAPRVIIRLFSLNGQLLRAETMDMDTTMSISASQLPAGNYMVQVLTDTGELLFVRRVVKS
ncbi:MAG: T9SS type A sorting domain-containing protein, partial [Bacteroidota bacterium]